MIGDLYKPLNPGEGDTVRLVMTVDEAKCLRSALAIARGMFIEGTYEELVHVLDRVLSKAEGSA